MCDSCYTPTVNICHVKFVDSKEPDTVYVVAHVFIFIFVRCNIIFVLPSISGIVIIKQCVCYYKLIENVIQVFHTLNNDRIV